jgi:hypothetical protein
MEAQQRTRRLRRPRLGTVLGGLALFIALQGTALALPGVNTVDSGDIVNNQVRAGDIGPIVRVNGTALSIAGGASGTAIANCPAGGRVLSVGYTRAASGLTIGVVDSTGIQARVTAFNHTGAPLDLTARAFCLLG